MDEGDGRVARRFELTRDMVTRIHKKSVWLCTVKTSDVRFAGTDANVSVQIYGEDGQSDIIPLGNKSDNFERNQVDEFKLEFFDIGVLRKLRVWHDNKWVALFSDVCGAWLTVGLLLASLCAVCRE